ncbi:hypothetical protein T10_549 [Trichinella papuae]|uniref:Uncharacterized protein n=1 Tax=Trichinella papuae TaxID=268474 RepID=A0A0V1N2I7_9BILA|nr:hypothetical protein T10_549 [Trichinella papuae]
MLKRETIIDRRPTTTTTTVIIFESEQNIVCLKALCECELSTIGAVEKGGHRTNTSTSNDNDDTMTTGHHQPPPEHIQTHRTYRQSTEQKPNIGAVQQRLLVGAKYFFNDTQWQ